ncbi:uncharacterized protein LOC120337750 [Styela clava]
MYFEEILRLIVLIAMCFAKDSDGCHSPGPPGLPHGLMTMLTSLSSQKTEGIDECGADLIEMIIEKYGEDALEWVLEDVSHVLDMAPYVNYRTFLYYLSKTESCTKFPGYCKIFSDCIRDNNQITWSWW